MISEEQIKKLANKFQIDEYSILREYLQILFLKYFYDLKHSEKIYFKGGTAIHFLLGSFRFSEDLDFTALLTAGDIKELLNETLKKINFEISDLQLIERESQKNSLNWQIKYQAGLKQPMTIRLEFSLREKPQTRLVSPLETEFPVTPYPLVVSLAPEELLAEKIRALIIRKKGRDLFDLWFLLSKGIKLDEKLITHKMRWYQKDYQEKNLLASIKSFEERQLENDLRQFLPKNYRPFIKELKNKTLEKLTGTQEPVPT